jgi:hypothetical protein
MTPPAPHAPKACEGHGCSAHHPSQHHMRDWPKVWRPYYGYSDRLCPHGVGHPDPDDIIDLQAAGGVSSAHSCDGCCLAPPRGTR